MNIIATMFRRSVSKTLLPSYVNSVSPLLYRCKITSDALKSNRMFEMPSLIGKSVKQLTRFSTFQNNDIKENGNLADESDNNSIETLSKNVYFSAYEKYYYGKKITKRPGNLIEIVSNQLVERKAYSLNSEWELVVSFFQAKNDYRLRFWPVQMLLHLQSTTQSHECAQIATSLLKWLNSRVDLNFVLDKKLFWLAYILCISEDVDKIKEVTSLLKDKWGEQNVIDEARATVLIKIYANIGKWREAIPLLDVSLTSNPLIQCALSEKDYDAVIELCDKYEDGPITIPDQISLLDKTVRLLMKEAVTVPEFMTRMFQLLRDKNWMLCHPIAYSVFEDFNRLPEKEWNVDRSHMDNLTGQCVNCGHQFPKLALTEEEFLTLRSSFMKDTFIQENILYTTTDEELARFLNFLKTDRKFNMVVDGLNIAFSQQHSTKYLNQNDRRQRQRRRVSLLHYFVQNLVERGYDVLVLAKCFLKDWDHEIIHSIESIASCFYTEQISRDDQFMLYSALYNGPGTYLISNDLMRKERYLLTGEGHKLFLKWQRIYHLQYDMQDNLLQIQWPDMYDIRTDYGENGFHFHYTDDTVGQHKISNKLLCGKRVKNSE